MHPREMEKERVVRSVIRVIHRKKTDGDPWKWWFEWCRSADPNYGVKRSRQITAKRRAQWERWHDGLNK